MGRLLFTFLMAYLAFDRLTRRLDYPVFADLAEEGESVYCFLVTDEYADKITFSEINQFNDLIDTQPDNRLN